MKKTCSYLAIGLSGLLLGGCQTVEYQRIGYGPELEYSKAQCELASMSVEQGVFAWGSTGYVLGAQLGNAIGNEIRKAEYVKRCMIMNGWKGVPAGQTASTRPTRGQSVSSMTTNAVTRPVRKQAPATLRRYSVPTGGPVVAGM